MLVYPLRVMVGMIVRMVLRIVVRMIPTNTSQYQPFVYHVGLPIEGNGEDDGDDYDEDSANIIHSVSALSRQTQWTLHCAL